MTGNTTGNGGLAGFGGVGGAGGGIANAGTLTATGDTIDQNSTGIGGVSQGQPGGRGGQGGGIAAFGTMTISNSTISSNTTGVGGSFESGGQNGAAGSGAGIGSDFTDGITASLTSLSVTNTTVANNARGSDQGADSAGVGSGIHVFTSGPATVSLAGTAVTGSSGIGIAAWALGGVNSGAVELSLRNVTIANSGGAGLYATTLYQGAAPSLSVNLGFTTIAGNGGAAVQAGSHGAPAPAPTVAAADSLFTSNQACSGALTDSGHNLSFGNGSCPGIVADPKLGVIGNYGGPTPTIPLLTGSAAIDAIPTSDSACAGTDQRGSARPGGLGCDIGAYEVAAPRLSGAAAAATGDTSGRVTAQVTPVGTAASIAVHFGKTTAYGATAAGPTLPAGAGASAVSVPLTGLTADTTYHAQLIATDAEGATSSQDVTFTTSRTPSGNNGGGGGGGNGGGGNGGGGNGGGGAVRPRLSGLSIAPGTFPAAPGPGGSIAGATGATVRYSDTAAATTTFTVQRVLSGHRDAKGSCSTRPVRRGSPRRRKCTLLVTLRGSFARKDTRGKNSFHFTGRLRRARLTAGHYRLVAIAGLGGKASPAISHSFTISR